jgi:hypothetical protein
LIDSAGHYLAAEGVDALIEVARESRNRRGIRALLGRRGTQPIPPKKEDLARLHGLVRSRLSFTVLEFGVGYSTLVLADALAKNEHEWRTAIDKPALQRQSMFHLFSVDASRQWLRFWARRIPNHLRSRVHLCYSRTSVGTFADQLCHYYEKLPDVIPDFVYLDGPSPRDVHGSIRGLSFRCPERTVMAGDLLLMESTLLPGTLILVDGRTNNARFLARNFRRTYTVKWDRDGDVTSFELDEERLGPLNVTGRDFLRSE